MPFASFFRDRSGVTAVEFAFIAPVLMLIICGIIEFGRFVFIGSAMDAALAKAGRHWMIAPTVSTEVVKSTYCERAFLTVCSETEFSVTTTAGTGGQLFRTIEATASFNSPLSGLLPLPPRISRSETIPIYPT